MTHTPTPWRLRGFVDGESQISASGWVDIAPTSEEFKTIGSLYNYDHTGEQNLANAEHIVKCVNAHEEMVSALQQAKELAVVACGMTGCRSDDEWVWDIQKTIDAALAKAGV